MTKRSRRILAVGVTTLMALIGAAIGIAFLHLRAPQSPFVRYTSDPLPDGTRYTFLYPNRCSPPSPGGQEVDIGDAEPPGPSTLSKVMSALGIQRAKTLGFIMMRVNLYPIPPEAATWHNGRHEEDGLFYHNTSLVDRPHRRMLVLTYIDYTRQQTRLHQESPLLARSFKLLPPGANAED